MHLYMWTFTCDMNCMYVLCACTLAHVWTYVHMPMCAYALCVFAHAVCRHMLVH